MTGAGTLATPSTATPPTTPGGGEAVSIDGLSKTFTVRRTWAETLRRPFDRPQQVALDDVSLHVRPGEFFGLLGPNGAGKTTLFKTLAGLILPDRGSARVGDLDVVRDRGRVGQILTPVIPDERSLYWRLSARENLRLFASLQKLSGGEAEARVGELLDAVGLSDTGHKMAGQFSSGMKQRLLIARALLARPRILLLDEPTRSLDPLSAKTFRTFLRDEVADAQGVTILLATHIAEEALELCDRLAVLHKGRLRAVGSVDELRAQVGDDRYRALVRAPGGDDPTDLLRDLDPAVATSPGDDEAHAPGWWWAEVDVPGDAGAAAAVLAQIHARGLEVGRFERMPMTLADLIERIVGDGIDA